MFSRAAIASLTGTDVLQVLLAKKHHVKTVVIGGRSDVPQQYCGYVGGESVSFVDIDSALIVSLLSLFYSFVILQMRRADHGYKEKDALSTRRSPYPVSSFFFR
jgi:hypothetical protein